MQRLLATLQRAEITPGIITNGHAEVQRAKLAAIEAKALFPIILVGHEEISAGRWGSGLQAQTSRVPLLRVCIHTCGHARALTSWGQAQISPAGGPQHVHACGHAWGCVVTR